MKKKIIKNQNLSKKKLMRNAKKNPNIVKRFKLNRVYIIKN